MVNEYVDVFLDLPPAGQVGSSLVPYIVRCPNCMVPSFFTNKTVAGTKSTRNSTCRVGGYLGNTSRYAFNTSASPFFSLLLISINGTSQKEMGMHQLGTLSCSHNQSVLQYASMLPCRYSHTARINFFEHISLALCLLK